MSENSPYELVKPSRWCEAPKQFSFTSLQAIAACPRRWQLLHSEWGSYPRFPERAHPSAVEGQIVHAALDLLSRALGRVGRPAFGSSEFQEAAAACSFWSLFETEINEWNARVAEHPRTGPGFVIRTRPRDLANRAVRLFREQYQAATGRPMPVVKQAVGIEKDSILGRLQRYGALSEVRLEHPSLPLAGILDLVVSEDDSTITIIDFKTGAPKESHKEQLLLYATLWWRATGQPPSRIEVQYLNHAREYLVEKLEVEACEQKIAKDIDNAMAMIAQQPAPARPTTDCGRCPVRARCDEGWSYVELARQPASRGTDCEVTVASVPTPTGFTGIRRDGSELNVVYNFSVGRTLPLLIFGTRVRLVDMVPASEGNAIEMRAWSECYLL